MSCLVVLLSCRFVVLLILKVQLSFTNNKTTRRQDQKKIIFLLPFLVYNK